MMDVSIWWLLVAFMVGGYAGAVLIALMSMAGDRGAGELRPLGRQHGGHHKRHDRPAHAHT
jgi:hypothetical protein